MFLQRLFNVGRQLASSNVLTTFQRASILPLRNFYETENKIEFLKRATIDENTCKSVVANVNELVNQQAEGRCFAVVHLCGKQYKVTAGDLLVIEGYWAPTTGDEIRLEKVLLAGSDNFTLIGRPLVHANLVDIQATIVEKTIAHTRTHFKRKRRKNFMRVNFHRSAQTMLRINSITLNGSIDADSADQNRLQ